MKKDQNRSLITDPTAAPDNKGSKPASKNASGPKTPAGKRRVRLNALRHGFYSRELVVHDNDKAEFEALRRGVQNHLKPNSPLQEIGFERVVSAAWRHKLALRMESIRLKPQIESGDRLESEELPTEFPVWYTSGRQELNRALKFLADLRDDVRENGDRHLAEHKDSIVKTFGPDFYNNLSQWGPINTVAVLFGEQLQQHAENFKMPLPSGAILPKNVRLAAGRARWEMMAKVVDLKLQEVSEFYRLLGQPVGEAESPQTVALDVVNRYVTSTGRELEHAVDWYGQLLEKGL